MRQKMVFEFDYDESKNNSVIESFHLADDWQLKIGKYAREDMNKSFSKTLLDGLTDGKITGSELLALALGGLQMSFQLAGAVKTKEELEVLQGVLK